MVEVIASVRQIGLSPAELAEVEAGNARRLLQRYPGDSGPDASAPPPCGEREGAIVSSVNNQPILPPCRAG